jgi:hypothetical protein
MSRATSSAPGNLGPVERVLRIVGGGLLAVVAAILWSSSSGVAAVAWVGLALLGLDFVVTGVRGYCPLYARLGIGRTR